MAWKRGAVFDYFATGTETPQRSTNAWACWRVQASANSRWGAESPGRCGGERVETQSLGRRPSSTQRRQFQLAHSIADPCRTNGPAASLAQGPAASAQSPPTVRVQASCSLQPARGHGSGTPSKDPDVAMRPNCNCSVLGDDHQTSKTTSSICCRKERQAVAQACAVASSWSKPESAALIRRQWMTTIKL